MPNSLTKKAGLTAVSNLLGQSVQIFVGFVVTPIVIRGLGAELYGALQMIEQAVQYLARSDLRPAGTLRVFLSVRQNSNDYHEKQRLIGASLLLCLFMWPLLLTVGLFLAWSAPSFIKVSSEHALAVQITMGIAVLRVGLDKLLGLPGSILGGVNLEYKAMGLGAATLLISGVLSAIAITVGWGLVGVGVAAATGVLLNGGIRFFVARKNIPWLGVARPSGAELASFTKSSSWFFVSSIADALLNISDLLIVGIVLGPAPAGIYATTGAVLRMVVAPFSRILSSTSAGIGDLCGQKDWSRVVLIRQEMHIIAMVVMTIISAGVIGLNRSFLGIWVGSGFYSGDLVNIIMVFIAYARVLLRADVVLLDNLLIFKERSIAFLGCGIFTFLTGYLLTYMVGVVGMALSVLFGQIGLFWFCNKFIQKRIENFDIKLMPFKPRLVIIMIAILVISYIININFQFNNFISFFFVAIFFTCINTIMLWLFGLDASNRSHFMCRFKTLLAR